MDRDILLEMVSIFLCATSKNKIQDPIKLSFCFALEDAMVLRFVAVCARSWTDYVDGETGTT